MASELNTKIAISLVAKLSESTLGGLKEFTKTVSELTTYTPGTTADTMTNLLYSDTRTLAASATENLDLAGGLTDALGATITAAEITTIYISAHASNTNNVVVGNVTNGFTGFIGATGELTLKPGDYALLNSKDGWTVTAGTGDLLKIANSAAGTGVTYSIVIIGRTAAS